MDWNLFCWWTCRLIQRWEWRAGVPLRLGGSDRSRRRGSGVCGCEGVFPFCIPAGGRVFNRGCFLGYLAEAQLGVDCLPRPPLRASSISPCCGGALRSGARECCSPRRSWLSPCCYLAHYLWWYRTACKTGRSPLTGKSISDHTNEHSPWSLQRSEIPCLPAGFVPSGREQLLLRIIF